MTSSMKRAHPDGGSAAPTTTAAAHAAPPAKRTTAGPVVPRNPPAPSARKTTTTRRTSDRFAPGSRLATARSGTMSRPGLTAARTMAPRHSATAAAAAPVSALTAEQTAVLDSISKNFPAWMHGIEEMKQMMLAQNASQGLFAELIQLPFLLSLSLSSFFSSCLTVGKQSPLTTLSACYSTC